MPARDPLTEEEIRNALAQLDGWEFDEDQLVTSFEFEDFRSAVAFIVRLAFEAEAMNHHPELFNVFNRVDIGLSTHDAGGKVTATDIELARRIDAL